MKSKILLVLLSVIAAAGFLYAASIDDIQTADGAQRIKLVDAFQDSVVAGSNVTVTQNDDGTVTIASTASGGAQTNAVNVWTANQFGTSTSSLTNWAVIHGAFLSITNNADIRGDTSAVLKLRHFGASVADSAPYIGFFGGTAGGTRTAYIGDADQVSSDLFIVAEVNNAAIRLISEPSSMQNFVQTATGVTIGANATRVNTFNGTNNFTGRISAPTNTANYAVSKSVPSAFNTVWITNGPNRATVTCSFDLTGAVGGEAACGLFSFIAGETNQVWAAFSGVAATSREQLTIDLQPSAILIVTNVNTGSATASIHTNSFNIFTK